MKYAQIVFSPTGGKKKAAEMITGNWPDVERIDLSAAAEDYGKYSFAPEDVVLIAMPSFGGLAPQTALDRLSKLKGNSARCAIMCVYGSRAYEDTLVQMEDMAKTCGFQVVAAVAAVAEHSILRQIAAGRPDESDSRQLAEFASKIKEKLESGNDSKPAIPGNRPYKKAGGAGMVPHGGSACTECGLCAKRCPVAAIDPHSPKSADKTKCISCMRCVSVCPRGARKVNPAMLAVVKVALKKACSGRKENELFL